MSPAASCFIASVLIGLTAAVTAYFVTAPTDAPEYVRYAFLAASLVPLWSGLALVVEEMRV